MPSSGYFTFPAHGEPGQGSARRQSSVLAGKLLFCNSPPRFSPARFQRFSRYRLPLLAPFLRRRGSFCSGTLLFRPFFFIFPLLFYFEKQKRRMRAFSFAALFGRKKISHSPVCDSVFLCLLGQKSDDMSSRPTKILKISAFRDFLSPCQSAKKGQKTG